MRLRKATRRAALLSMAGAIGVIAMLSSLAAPVCAEEVKAGDLVITQAWSRATPGGAKIGGGYLTIENKGATADRLIGGSADIAGKIEVHEMTMKDGVMTMRPLDKGLSIEPGKTVKLAPGGYHLMMFDLKSPLKQGEKLPVTLDFEKAGKVKVSLDVAGVGAQGPGNAVGGHMDDEEDARSFRHEDVRAMTAKAGRSSLLAAAVMLAACGRRRPRTPLALHIHTENAMFQVLVSPGTVGTDRFRSSVDDRRRQPAGGQRRPRLILSLPGRGDRAAGAPATLGSDGYWHVARACRFRCPGRWHLRIEALVTDFQKIALEDDFEVPAP